MKNNYSEVKSFCDLLYPTENISFDTFSKQNPSIRRKFLHGSLDEHWDELVYLNSMGADVFSMVNVGDGRARSADHVVEITSIFLDLDGSSLEPLLNCPVFPHIILMTSSGRYQCRWKIRPVQITDQNRQEMKYLFKNVQLSIAEKFSGDPSVNDLGRLARIPQLYNQKYDSPYLIHTYQMTDSPILIIDDFVRAFEIDITRRPYDFPKLVKLSDIEVDLEGPPICDGTRHTTMLAICRKLAYKGFLDDNLFEQAYLINETRCQPPLEYNDLRGMTTSVSGYWHARYMAPDDCVSKILENNPYLMIHNGTFYRYDRRSKEYKAMEMRTFTNLIWELYQYTAGPALIKHVMDELIIQTPEHKTQPVNMETRFLDECISYGGRAVLEDIFNLYFNWCKRNRYKDVTISALRREIESKFGVKRYQMELPGGRRSYGFRGISIDQDSLRSCTHCTS
jgi:hypothetical protein